MKVPWLSQSPKGATVLFKNVVEIFTRGEHRKVSVDRTRILNQDRSVIPHIEGQGVRAGPPRTVGMLRKAFTGKHTGLQRRE